MTKTSDAMEIQLETKVFWHEKLVPVKYELLDDGQILYMLPFHSAFSALTLFIGR